MRSLRIAVGGSGGRSSGGPTTGTSTVLRATNTGVTAVIGPDGAIVERIPQFEPGYVDADIYPRSGQPPYLAFGNWPVLIVCALVLLAAGAVSRRLSS